MKDKTKQEIGLALEILRKSLIDNAVSMAVNKDDGTLYFFDTEAYCRNRAFDGFKVNIQSLVR